MAEDIRELGKKVKWNCIVITCADSKWKQVIEEEVSKLSQANLLPHHHMVLVIDDPQIFSSDSRSCGVGSGGATLNALLIVAERISALASHTTINSDAFSKNLILIVHYGRNSYQYNGGNIFLPMGPSFSWVPPSCASPVSSTLLQNSLWMTSILASQSSSGVWITSLDFFIPFDPTVSLPSASTLERTLVCSINPNNLVDTSGQHGRLYCDFEGRLEEIVYQTIPSCCDGSDARIVCGPTYFPHSLAERVLSLHTLPPLDRCTYYGTDTNIEPLQISLYFDIFLPMCGQTEKDRYLSGELTSSYAKSANFSTLKQQEGVRARQNIWNQLRPYAAFEHQLNINQSVHCNPCHAFSSGLVHLFKSLFIAPVVAPLEEHFEKENIWNHNSMFYGSCSIEESCHLMLINSHLGPYFNLEASGDCVVLDFLLPEVKFDKVNIGSRMVWQRWPLINSANVVITCHGFDDNFNIDKTCEGFKIFNKPWDEFSSKLSLSSNDLWGNCENGSLSTAKLYPSSLTAREQLCILGILFGSGTCSDASKWKCAVLKWKRCPRMSLEDVRSSFDAKRLFREREDTFMKRVGRFIEETSQLTIGPALLPLSKYVSAISSERVMELLGVFHRVLQRPSPATSRLLANIADLLGCLAGPMGGLRSGPAANRNWLPALKALKDGFYSDSFKLLETVCRDFIRSGRPEDIMRASRHYERASHIFISKQVESANYQVFPLANGPSASTRIGKGIWVEGFCPARLDLAGGWTDTPPICYELGGVVLNVAIKVNGRKPIGAKARITDELNITCILRDNSGAELSLVWESLEDLKDYDNPVSSGALIKASLVYSSFVRLEDTEFSTLQDQLKCRYDGGLEIIVWSELPQGSGLGGSSLLAGTILGVLFVVMGFHPLPVDSLVHATLGIEQMLTTGGGWQDQVGGLIGGMKLGVSRPRIPLVVESYSIPLDEEFLDFLNSHLALVFTGKVRLARNLLQSVVRNWYAREERVTACFDALRSCALKAAEAALLKNATLLGECINRYWQLKKVVAPGCEPSRVTRLMNSTRYLMLGQSLAGAGGGGYLYGLTNSPCRTLEQLLATSFKSMKSDSVEIDMEGLVLTVDGEIVMEAGSHRKKLTTAHLAHECLQEEFVTQKEA